MNSTPRQGRRGRRIATTAAVTTLLLLTAAGAAYGVLGFTRATDTALRDRTVAAPAPTDPAPRDEAPAEPAPTDPTTDAAEPEPSEPAAPSEPPRTVEPEPEPVLEPGDEGRQVRELQSRLAQIAWFSPVTTGAYDEATRTAVSGFQEKRGLTGTGVVDERTWRRLLGMTAQPTEAQLFNKPGPALWDRGDSGPEVREIQARLRQIAWFFGDVSDNYGPQTQEAVTGFQDKRGIPQTGAVDRRTLDLLEGMTTEPTAADLANRKPDPADGAALDPRCLTGMALCIDKSSQSLRWVVDGKVRSTVDVRFGADQTPTREGVFSVYRKSRDHVSTLYHSSMPFSMFFSGGQAVHYSSDFAARGYAGASHGCVNVRDYDALAAMFDGVPIGTRVVVYRS